MATLHAIGKVKIQVFSQDHLPAHFHVAHPDFAALVEIATMTVIRGSIPARFAAEVLTWAEANRAALVAAWNRNNPRYPFAGG